MEEEREEGTERERESTSVCACVGELRKKKTNAGEYNKQSKLHNNLDFFAQLALLILRGQWG
jgi:hypothetical protein